MTIPTQSAKGTWPNWTERFREVAGTAQQDYAQEAADQALDEYARVLRNLSKQCESPIEALFLAAFLPFKLRLHTPAWCEYDIKPQHKIGDYRVDFLVTFDPVAHGPELVRQVVVECDGHDYHDRTREQAERDRRRDRFFAGKGIPLLRFTGREIHRDARACVDEVIELTQGVMLDDITKAWRARVDENRGI